MTGRENSVKQGEQKVMKIDSLTLMQRLQLATQYRILEKLEPNEPVWRKGAEAFEQGYTKFYDDVTLHIEPDEMSIAECDYVYNILGLYSDLKDSYVKLTNKENLSLSHVTFPGFDGNHELKEYFFAKFLKGQGLWKHVLGDDPNSHHETAPRYHQMLNRASKFTQQERVNLTAAQIKSIIE